MVSTLVSIQTSFDNCVVDAGVGIAVMWRFQSEKCVSICERKRSERGRQGETKLRCEVEGSILGWQTAVYVDGA